MSLAMNYLQSSGDAHSLKKFTASRLFGDISLFLI